MRRVLAFAALVAVFSCSSQVVEESDRRAIEQTLELYVLRMAEAYQSGDAARVAEVATEREQHRLRQAIDELGAEGRALRPTLQRLAVETMEPASRTTVLVGTIETWDLRVVALGSEKTVSESLGQENRLSYVLIREQGVWRILSRQLKSSNQNP